MNQLHITKVHISLKVEIPNEILQRHLASSAQAVGEALTEEVLKFVKKNSLDYFPALEYLQKLGELDDDLIDAAETIGWFSAKIAREEVQNKLRGFFSTLSFQSVQTLAFNIIASVLKREQLDGIANWAKQLFRRNLENSFEEFEVTQSSIIK